MIAVGRRFCSRIWYRLRLELLIEHEIPNAAIQRYTESSNVLNNGLNPMSFYPLVLDDLRNEEKGRIGKTPFRASTGCVRGDEEVLRLRQRPGQGWFACPSDRSGQNLHDGKVGL